MLNNVRLHDLVAWSGANLGGPTSANPVIETICTDSRQLKTGDLFVALRGEKFDGHAFLGECAGKGAAAVMSEQAIDLPVPTLVVKDSLSALIAIAKELRGKFKGPVIAVTGSAGKSSTKDAIATLLGPNTLKSPASFNNLLGVSKTLCLLDNATKQMVLEMGMNALGEIRELCETFRPHYGLITNIGDAHIGKLGGADGVYRAKKEMFDYLAKSPDTRGVALNIDDARVTEAFRAAFKKAGTSKTYSALGADADVSLLDKTVNPETAELDFSIRIEGETHAFHVPLFGLHHGQNIAAAVAMALLLGVKKKLVLDRIPEIRPATHRGEIFSLGQDRVLIDESYNSNPTALRSSLETLAELSPARRRLLVLGEMRELGEFTDSLHQEIGETLVSLHAQKKFPFILVGVGAATAKIIEPVKRQLPSVPWFQTDTARDAISRVQALLRPGDVLFVKGSRGIGLDAVVRAFVRTP